MKFKLIHNNITEQQIQELAERLTPEDKNEIKAVGYTSTYHGLSRSIKTSNTYSLIQTLDGQPAGVAGVMDWDDDIGAVWLLTTDAAKSAPLSFVKQSKYWLDSLKGQYLMLHNCADARNTNHLKLLKLLGFYKLRYVPVGPEKRTFVEFAKLL